MTDNRVKSGSLRPARARVCLPKIENWPFSSRNAGSRLIAVFCISLVNVTPNWLASARYSVWRAAVPITSLNNPAWSARQLISLRLQLFWCAQPVVFSCGNRMLACFNCYTLMIRNHLTYLRFPQSEPGGKKNKKIFIIGDLAPSLIDRNMSLSLLDAGRA